MWSLISVILLWRMDREYLGKGTIEKGNACFCKWEECCVFVLICFMICIIYEM